MFPDLPGRTALLALIALAPAAMRWWWGRALVRQASDPALPERMLALARRSSAATALACAALIVLSPRAALWTLPLLLVSRLVAAYPVRRALLAERWSLPTYLWFFLRLIAAVYGLWILIAALPLVVPLAGSLDWLAATVLAAILIGWSARSADVVRRILRSRAIEDAPTLARFAGMAETAGIPTPRFEQVDLRGGALANAVAVPSPRTAAVLFTDVLLAELSGAEVNAICAHELAHLEHFTARRVRRMHLVTSALILTGAALGPAARVVGISSRFASTMFWYLAFVAVAVWRARHRQRNETASDLRAVALCGDAEALVRGLTKLYTLGRVPRRLDAQLERQATHPSLARRIRDIRRAAGTETAMLSEDIRFAAPGGPTVVTFQPGHVQWSEGDAATHTLSYAHLAEVRVSAKHAGPASLIVVERGGRRWTMPLESGDVARAQAVLDVVDGRLGESPPLPRVWPRVVRLISLVASAFALMLGHIAAAVLGLFVAMRPSASLLAALGFGTLAAAALTVRDFGAAGRQSVVALLLAAVALGLLAVARAARRDEHAAANPRPVVVLGVCAVLAIAALGFGGLDAISLHQSARAMSAATVLSFALAGALAWSRRRAAQYAALAAAGLAAFVSLTASTWFLDRFGHDLLLVRVEPFTAEAVGAPTSSEVLLPFYASTLRLSPAGRAVVAGEENESAEDERVTLHVGPLGGTLTPVNADDARFVDEEHVLLLIVQRDGVDLREVAVAAPAQPIWQQHLPPIAGARLSLEPMQQAWQVIGWNRARDVIRLEGHIGSTDVRERRWSREATGEGYISAVAASNDKVVLVESHYDFGFVQRAGFRLWKGLPFALPKVESRFWWIGEGGAREMRASRFGAQCLSTSAGEARLICSVFDGTQTRMVSLDPDGQVVPLGVLTGRFFGRSVAGNGWLTGWSESSPVALQFSTRRVYRVAGARGEWIADIGGDNRTFATVGYANSGSFVRRYRVVD